MQQPIRLNINNPCSENWHQMPPNDQGRFCGSCQKTVVDFSTMDDQELVKWFTQHRGSVCGRLKKDQLDRPLLTPQAPKKIHLRYWHYVIAGLLFSAEASAQSNPAIIQTTQNPSSRPEINELMGDTILFTPKHEPSDSIRDRSFREDVFAGGITAVSVRHRRKPKPSTDTLSFIKDTLASIGLIKPALTAYPNPVARGGNITIATRLDQSGNYSLQLYSSTGALITSRELNSATNTGNIAFPVPAGLVPGIYFVKLSHPALKKCYTQEIMVY